MCRILTKRATMKKNEKMREMIFEIINTQIKNNDPPETKITFDRLQKQGFDDFRIKQMLGQCIAVEVFAVMKRGETFNNERYIKHLLALPKEPYD